MSRIPSNSSQASNSRFKISAPQPYQPPVRTFPSSTSTSTATLGSSSPNLARTGSGSASELTGGSNPNAPLRPARSVRRPPNFPGSSPLVPSASVGAAYESPGGYTADGGGRRESNDYDYGYSPVEETPSQQAGYSRFEIPPPAAPSGRVHGDGYFDGSRGTGGGGGGYEHERNLDSISPHQPSTSTSSAAPRWEADRSERSEFIRQQQEQAAKEAKLRGVVDAFKKVTVTPSSSSVETSGASKLGGDRGRNLSGSGQSQGQIQNQTEESRAGNRPGLNRANTQTSQYVDENLMLGSGGIEFADVDAVLRKIKRDWPFVLDKHFAPTSLALSLLEPIENPRATPSSAHPPLSDFVQLHTQLSTSLSRAVQKHYQTYASSLPAHRNLVDALARAQTIVKSTKKQLKESKALLAGSSPAAIKSTSGKMIALNGGNKRAEMVTLRGREKTLRDMLKTLDAIEDLKQIPDRLENLIGDKRFLESALILTRSIKKINKPEMMAVGALAELRAYLRSQLGTLTDILVEELHNHLYLKSFYTQNRWSAWQPNQTEFPKTAYDLEEVTAWLVDDDALSQSVEAPTTRKGGPGSSRLSRFLTSLAIKPSVDSSQEFTDEDLLKTSRPIFSLTSTRGNNSTTGRGEGHASASSVNALVGGAGKEDRMLPVRNPELDSFAYIEMLLESLAILGRLGYAVEVTIQRMPTELFGVVEATIEEVGERMELRKLQGGSSSKRPQSMHLSTGEEDEAGVGIGIGAIEAMKNTTGGDERGGQFRAQISALQGNEADSDTLKDLFWTTCSKINAIAEGHRVLYEIIQRITMRGTYRDTSGPNLDRTTMVTPLEDIVRPIQLEMRTLLHDYLTDRDRGSSMNRKPLMSINEILRDGGSIARDRNQPIFRFADADITSLSKDLNTYKDALNATLQASLPGLALVPEKNAGRATSASTATAAILSATEDRLQDGFQHTLLVAPNPFNVVTVFEPCLAFIRSLKRITPNFVETESINFGVYMDDFIVKVYLPQLEDKVISLYQQAVGGSSSFAQDLYWREFSEFPVVKSTTDVMALVLTLCKMMATSPFRKDDYSRLVVNLIVRYYQRCSSQYRDIVTKSGESTNFPLSATWAQREDVLDHLRSLKKARTTSDIKMHSMRELQLEVNLSADRELVAERDLIGSGSRFRALAELYQSILWLMAELEKLKAVSDEAFSPQTELPNNPLLNSPTTPDDEGTPLLLSTAMAQ